MGYVEQVISIDLRYSFRTHSENMIVTSRFSTSGDRDIRGRKASDAEDAMLWTKVEEKKPYYSGLMLDLRCGGTPVEAFPVIAVFLKPPSSTVSPVPCIPWVFNVLVFLAAADLLKHTANQRTFSSPSKHYTGIKLAIFRFIATSNTWLSLSATAY